MTSAQVVDRDWFSAIAPGASTYHVAPTRDSPSGTKKQGTRQERPSRKPVCARVSPSGVTSDFLLSAIHDHLRSLRGTLLREYSSAKTPYPSLKPYTLDLRVQTVDPIPENLKCR
jgi:hypothetical protein